MTTDRVLFTGLPAILTLALHGGLALMLVVRWTGPSDVIAAAPSIDPIQANLVQAETLQLKPKPQPKPKAEPPPVPQQAPEPTPVPTPVPQQAPEPAPESKPAEVTKLEPALDAEQLAALTRNEIDSLVDAEISVTDANEPSLRDVVAATIRASVINRWTRPPSARNGMVSILSIQLVPTGEVVGVSVLQSSGNTAFDRSAMTAVERTGRFPEVAKLDNRTFEANFRRFQLIFKPEDLRY